METACCEGRGGTMAEELPALAAVWRDILSGPRVGQSGRAFSSGFVRCPGSELRLNVAGAKDLVSMIAADD